MRHCTRTGKLIHESANAARRGVTRGNFARPYRCNYCHGWHATHHRAEIPPMSKWRERAFGPDL